MGDAFSVEESREGDSDRQPLHTLDGDLPPLHTIDGDSARYLAQFLDQDDPLLLTNLEQLQDYEVDVVETIAGDSCSCGANLESANLGTRLQADLNSLVFPGHGEPVPDCEEVCKVVCFSMDHPVSEDVAESTGHLLYPAQPLKGSFREGRDYYSPAELRWGAYGFTVPGEFGSAPLRVPVEFRDLGFDWTSPMSEQKKMTKTQKSALQRCMKPFLRCAMAGIRLQLRLDPDEANGSPEGSNIDAKLTLSKDLNVLTLKAAGVMRQIQLTDIRWVRCGQAVPETKPRPSAAAEATSTAAIDRHRLVVFRLSAGRFISFLFEHRDQAAFFGCYMRLLAKAAVGVGRASVGRASTTSTAASSAGLGVCDL
eukprot:TRINITY_DN3633_c0_g4_i1.p1 TRINITY_DN3633_c0_g4~~TRINITY_DN3633_c0_g4_i1.p1  ORF type:complete len:368 (-),score=84.67 TRINITY_DN3633_c0_g4_i1:56-1159(-)